MASFAVNGDSLEPGLGAGGFNPEVEAIAVRVGGRAFDGSNERRGPGLVLPVCAHRIQTQHTFLYSCLYTTLDTIILRNTPDFLGTSWIRKRPFPAHFEHEMAVLKRPVNDKMAERASVGYLVMSCLK